MELPDGVIALFFLLSLLLLIGVRVVARSLYERRPLGASAPVDAASATS